MPDTQARRSLPIDVLKTIAILFVIIIHASFDGYANPMGSVDWYSTVFWGSLARPAVPLFLMCSGALMLDPGRPLPLKKLWLKNILRIAVALLVWAMGYKVWGLLRGPGLSWAGLVQSAKEVLLFRHRFHLYYLHILLLVYAMLPVTRVFTAHASRREALYFLGLWFVLGILYPLARNFWPVTLLEGIPLQWMINSTWSAIGYGVAGYYLRQNPPSRGVSALLLGCGFVGVFVGTVCMSYAQGSLSEAFYGGMTPFVMLMTFGIYGLAHRLVKPAFKGAGLFVRVSKSTLCVYLVHIFFLDLFDTVGLTVGMLPSILSIPLLSLICFALSWAVWFVLSHVPVVNKYLV